MTNELANAIGRSWRTKGTHFNTLDGAIDYAARIGNDHAIRIMGYGAYCDKPRQGGRAIVSDWAKPGYYLRHGDDIRAANVRIFRDGGTHFRVLHYAQ